MEGRATKSLLLQAVWASQPPQSSVRVFVALIPRNLSIYLPTGSILAAYDLGASPGLLQKIYDNEASSQRPIVLEEKDKDITIDEDSWSQYLGDQK